MIKKVISLKPLLNCLQLIVLTLNVKLRVVRISLRTNRYEILEGESESSRNIGQFPFCYFVCGI